MLGGRDCALQSLQASVDLRFKLGCRRVRDLFSGGLRSLTFSGVSLERCRAQMYERFQDSFGIRLVGLG